MSTEVCHKAADIPNNYSNAPLLSSSVNGQRVNDNDNDNDDATVERSCLRQPQGEDDTDVTVVSTDSTV
jgi:hypothetical protein